jgi:hypothetical protein
MRRTLGIWAIAGAPFLLLCVLVALWHNAISAVLFSPLAWENWQFVYVLPIAGFVLALTAREPVHGLQLSRPNGLDGGIWSVVEFLRVHNLADL